GADKWVQVLKELDEPPINRDNTVHFEEVHIEQSRLGEMKEADVGIVSQGIGGSRREKVQVSVDQLKKEALIVPESIPYVRMNITTHGRAEHSGGTPPNTIWHEKGILGGRDDGRMITRSDALVALSHMIADIEQYRLQPLDSQQLPLDLRGQVAEFNQRAEQSGFPRWARIASITSPVETGYTTIPAEQTLEVLLPRQHEEVFRQLVQQHSGVMRREGVGYEIATESIHPGTYTVIPLSNAIAAMGIAGAVAHEVEMHVLGRWVVDPKHVSDVGEVRATVTDFNFDPTNGLRFKIDERNVDSEQGKKIAGAIGSLVERNLMSMGIDSQESRTVVSDTSPSPIDRQSVETKLSIAQTLGFKPVVMPSVPGQDAGSISKAGIPTSMTYICHPGISHSPDESVDPPYLEKAVAVSHAYLMRLLNSAA
ncbi:MAG: M20/M25/M40 family metallo-hydrolase, partial [Candidatus Peribacteraceae bacterium]|nr:M20/M25/M40 family metallo-hydrolase [Candidatus Peribacteraceae bacterium]